MFTVFFTSSLFDLRSVDLSIVYSIFWDNSTTGTTGYLFKWAMLLKISQILPAFSIWKNSVVILECVP